MNQVAEKEYPGCNRCGMHKLKVDNQLKCPNCDTQSEPSGLVSHTKDPGVGGFVKKTIKGTDGKQYEVMVAADVPEDEVVGDTPTVPEGFPAGKRPISIPHVPADASIPQTGTEVMGLMHEQETFRERPELLLQAIRLIFQQHPARTLAEFKRLKKVRDQIDKLEFLITNLKEG